MTFFESFWLRWKVQDPSHKKGKILQRLESYATLLKKFQLLILALISKIPVFQLPPGILHKNAKKAGPIERTPKFLFSITM